MRQRPATAAIAAAILATAGPAIAHHSIHAQYDTSREREVTGVLDRFDQINPHSRWRMTVAGADGRAEAWEMEGAGAGLLRRSGVDLDEHLKVGQTYTFHFYAPRGDEKGGYIRAISMDGERISLTRFGARTGE